MNIGETLDRSYSQGIDHPAHKQTTPIQQHICQRQLFGPCPMYAEFQNVNYFQMLSTAFRASTLKTIEMTV